MDSRERDRTEHGRSAPAPWNSIRSPGILNMVLPHLPFVRPNTPSQVANAVVSLLGDDSCDVGGVELVVEGDIARLSMLSSDPPLVKPAGPEEIAQDAVYLASGDSKGITGMEVLVDGGMAPL